MCNFIFQEVCSNGSKSKQYKYIIYEKTPTSVLTLSLTDGDCNLFLCVLLSLLYKYISKYEYMYIPFLDLKRAYYK